MIDTGAAPNIIKKRNILPENKINTGNTFVLSGITQGNIATLKSVKINYMGYPIELHVVSDSFPITQENILRSTFLNDAESINFKKQQITWQGITIPLLQKKAITIPARARAVMPLVIKKSAG